VEGVRANEDRCRHHVESSTATVTALVPAIGYEGASQLAKRANERRKTIKEVAIEEGMLTPEQFDELVSPEAVCRLGSPSFQGKRNDDSRNTKVLDSISVSLVGETWEVEPPQCDHASECIHCFGGCGHNHGPGGKADGASSLGPVLFIDTAGRRYRCPRKLRIHRTHQVFDRTDLGVIVSEAGIWGDFEEQLLKELKERKVPVVAVFNKSDIAEPNGTVLSRLTAQKIPVVKTSAVSGGGILDFRQALLDTAPSEFVNNPTILSDLVGPGEMAVLVVPIDKEAPKGRLILPQVQAIGISSIVMRTVWLSGTGTTPCFGTIEATPRLVVTDSQAFLKVTADTLETFPDLLFHPFCPLQRRSFRTRSWDPRHRSTETGDRV
jgi:hypothetical protein